MDTLPLYISLVFGITLLATIVLFYKATHSSKTVLALLILWIIAQSIVSFTGFYKLENTMPPRFALLLMPPVILIILLFITKKGKIFMDGLDIKMLTMIHIIRIPVEIILLWLFMHKAVPQLMTFEGRNFDILSGISVPVVYYFAFYYKKNNTSFLLIWNFCCLALLFNIVFYAVFSLPTLFQKFSFGQPNIALLYYPFILLPSVLVPIVMFSHLVSIRQIIFRKYLL